MGKEGTWDNADHQLPLWEMADTTSYPAPGSGQCSQGLVRRRMAGLGTRAVAQLGAEGGTVQAGDLVHPRAPLARGLVARLPAQAKHCVPLVMWL